MDFPSGTWSKICIKVTLGLCTCGAILGFCFLVAGGVEQSHHDNIKVLMYIGILMFLVSFFLLVTLCSSFGIFNLYPAVGNVPEESHCTCPPETFKVIPTNHVIYSYPKKGSSQHAAPHYCPLQNSQGSTPVPIPIHYDVIKEEFPRCTVKNCVCLSKNLEHENKPKKEIIQIPFHFNHSANGCSICCYNGPHLIAPVTYYCRLGNDSCIHHSLPPSGLNPSKICSLNKQEKSIEKQEKHPPKKKSALIKEKPSKQ